ncbi:MAG TPA: hypothetical protein VGC42_17760 [Kofleriaceae bacterium]
MFGTPRLTDADTLELRRPFRDPARDALFAARHTAAPVGPLLEALATRAC